MKQQLLFLFLMFLIPTWMACGNTNMPGTKLSATVKSGESYTYSLGQFGIEDGASIYEQADHSSVSEVKREGSTMVYHYNPSDNYRGNDMVVIKTKKGDIGDGKSGTEAFVTINISVIP